VSKNISSPTVSSSLVEVSSLVHIVECPLSIWSVLAQGQGVSTSAIVVNEDLHHSSPLSRGTYCLNCQQKASSCHSLRTCLSCRTPFCPGAQLPTQLTTYVGHVVCVKAQPSQSNNSNGPLMLHSCPGLVRPNGSASSSA
jgi:hypothetical protein